jgi:glycosyltransferase involved in cell wall biosynthesis
VWPHRWEHDKGPEELLEIADRHAERLDLRFIVLGERFRRVPAALETFLDRHAERIDHAGFVEDRRAYWRQLERADWVLSTALHEFFGIAVVEALLAGCLPWLPARLSYPEIVPDEAIASSPLDPPRDPTALRRAVAAHLDDALAPRSVAKLDEALERLASR